LNDRWNIGRTPQKTRKPYSKETIELLRTRRKEYWQRKKQII